MQEVGTLHQCDCLFSRFLGEAKKAVPLLKVPRFQGIVCLTGPVLAGVKLALDDGKGDDDRTRNGVGEVVDIIKDIKTPFVGFSKVAFPQL